MSQTFRAVAIQLLRLVDHSEETSFEFLLQLERLLAAKVGPVVDPIDYNPIEGNPPKLCRPTFKIGSYAFNATSSEYGLPTNRDPIINTPRAGGLKHPHGPPEWAITHIARWIVYFRALAFIIEEKATRDEFNRKIFEIEYLRESGFFKLVPTYQWVLNGTNSVPILDFDVLPRGIESLSVIIDCLKDFFNDESFKPVVFTRQASVDQIKAHIYLTGLFLTTHDIKRICQHISDQTGIDADTAIYSGRHTLRVPGNLKNSFSFGSAKQRLSELFDPDLFAHMNITFTFEEYIANMLEIRRDCREEQCANIYNSRGHDILDPFADQLKRNRLARNLFCPACAKACWEYILNKCYPFCPPKAADVRDRIVLTTLNSALRPQPLSVPVRSSAELTTLSSPFLSVISFTRDECKMNTFADRLAKEWKTLPSFCSSSSIFFEECYAWFDRLTLLTSRYTARHSEGKCIWVLVEDGNLGTGIIVEHPNEFFKSSNFPRTFCTYCKIESGSPDLIPGFKTLDHALAATIAIKNIGKKDSFHLEFKIKEADLLSICSSLNRLARIAWTPYNHLIEMDRDAQKVNHYCPPMLGTVGVDYQITDIDGFFEKFNRHMQLSFNHLFLNEQYGWTKGDCLRTFFLFWRFVALKIRFPGGYNKEGICLSRPDLVWWFTGWEGCGKTTSILDFFTALFVYVADVRNVDSRFDANENFRGKMFSIFDEAHLKDANLIKSSTNKRMSAARKYLSNIEFNNHSSLILLCNDVLRESLCGIDASDRRNVFLRCLNRMPPEERSFIPSLTHNQEYLADFFYCFSVGFPEEFLLRCEPFVGDLIRQLNKDYQSSVGDWESRFEYFNFWAGIAAPWTPAKKAVLERFMDAPKKYLLQWLEKGVNFSAAFKFLPTWLLKDPKWWDRDGYWLRMIPIGCVHQTYSAFTTSNSATSQIDWEDLFRKFFCPEGLPVPTFDLTERIDSCIDDLDCAIFHTSSGSFFLIPPYQNCVENFVENCQWHGWQPLYVYSNLGSDFYSHHMVRYLSGYHLSQAVDADTHRPLYQEDTEPLEDVSFTRNYTRFSHLRLSRLGAPFYVLFSSTQEMQKKANALMHEQVVKEIYACREGRGIYRDGHIEANTISNLKRTLSFSQARNSQDNGSFLHDDYDDDNFEVDIEADDAPTQKTARFF